MFVSIKRKMAEPMGLNFFVATYMTQKKVHGWKMSSQKDDVFFQKHLTYRKISEFYFVWKTEHFVTSW